MLNSATIRVFHNMEATLFFYFARPSAGSLVLAIANGLGARLAADAGITHVVERVVGDVVLHDEAPNIFFGPVKQRVYLDQTEFVVPSDDRGFGAVGGLVLPDGANPSVITGYRPLERDHFAIIAALIRSVRPEWATMFFFVLGHSGAGAHILDFNPIAFEYPFPELKRFRELVACVEVEDADIWVDFRDHMDDAAPFGPKSGRHGESGHEFPNRKGKDFLSGSPFKAAIPFCQLIFPGRGQNAFAGING